MAGFLTAQPAKHTKKFPPAKFSRLAFGGG